MADSYHRLLDHLCELSVTRRWEAYRDILWTDPANAIDREDPRWELPSWDPVGGSEWYRDQAPTLRSAVGLHRAAAEIMRVAIDFESGLQQGLLAFTAQLPDGHPAFRYAYHEIAEEAQHSLMFQEFVNRAGFPTTPRVSPMAARNSVLDVVRETPVLFFISVLSGEEPIDVIQHRILRDVRPQHPLMMRICHIHCQEEARHLSFARAFIKEAAPRLTEREVRRIAYEAPFLVQRMTHRMIGVSSEFAEHWNMPESVSFEIDAGAAQGALMHSGIESIAQVCRLAGLIPTRMEPVWAGLHDMRQSTPA